MTVANGPLLMNYPAVLASAVPSTPACPELAPAPVSPQTPALPRPAPMLLKPEDAPTMPRFGLSPVTAVLAVVVARMASVDETTEIVPSKFWSPVKVFDTPSCGTLVVSRFNVTLPLVPPPVRSVPAVTPVIVPVPALEQLHALPMNSNT